MLRVEHGMKKREEEMKKVSVNLIYEEPRKKEELTMNKKRYEISQLRSVMGMFLLIGVLMFSMESEAIVRKAVKEITEEVFELVLKKGGKEFAEGVGKKVGKEAVEEMTERAIREVGEEGAKRLMRELGEQAIKHGDDVFLVAKRFGVSRVMHVLREMPEATGKQAVKALLNRGDELMPLVQRVGKEVLEVEVKHPGLAKRVFENFGQDGLKAVKNFSTDRSILLLKRSDVINGLSPEIRRTFWERLKEGTGDTVKEIFDIFERHPNVTDAIKKITIVLGGTYIVADKLGTSEMERRLPDGSVEKEKMSILGSKTKIYNPDGSIEEKTGGGLIEGFKEGSSRGIFILCVLVGIGIGGYFIIRGAVPLVRVLKSNRMPVDRDRKIY